MKVKRLVSIILTVLLLVGMIPMNAMAAMELESGKTLDKSPGPGEETAYDVARVKLMVSKSFGDKFTDKSGEVYDLDQLMEEEELDTLTAAYNAATEMNKGSIYNTSNNKTEQQVKDNVKIADSAFDTESASQDELEVSPGEIVYLAIKFSVENPQNTMGVVPVIGAFIKYDSNQLEPPNESAYYDNIAVNAISTGLNAKMNSSITGAELTAMLKGYHTSWELSSGIEISAANEKGERFMGITMTSSDNNATMLPSESKWELVIPMKVKANAKLERTTLSAVPQGASSDKLCSIDLAPASFSGTYGTDALAPRTTLKPNSDHMVVSNDIVLNIVKYSEPAAAEEKDYENSITNNTNLPYLTEAEAGKQANGGHGPNDYITFPEEEDGFELGDEIHVFSSADGKAEHELGYTTLNIGNFYKTDVSGTVTGMYTDADASGFTVAGKTLRLAVEETIQPDDEQEEEEKEPTIKVYNGEGYIKDQKEVWIGRLHHTGGPNDGTIIKPDDLIKVVITPETSLSYSDDVNAVAEGDGSSKKTPITVQFGDELKKALANVSTYSSEVKAPAENGKLIDTTVDWTTGWATEKVENNGKLTTDKFNAHGIAIIKAPFKEKSVQLVAGSDDPTMVKYHQPTAKVAIKDGTPTAEPTPVYGSQIYVQINPNPADYMATVNDGSSGGKLVVVGDSKTAWGKLAGEGYTVKLYSNYDNEQPSGEISSTVSHFGDQSWGSDFGVMPISSGMPAAGGKIYVKITQGELEYPVFAVPVAKSGYRVASDAKISNTDANNQLLIQLEDKVEDIFEMADPVFTIRSDKSNEDDQEIHLMDLYEQEEDGDPVFKAAKVTVKRQGVANGSSWSGTEYNKDSAGPRDELESGDQLEFTYTIPGTPEGGYYVESAVSTLAEGSETTRTAVTFSNESGCQVVIQARIVKQITLNGVASLEGITTRIIENNPLNENDKFIIQGDDQHINHPTDDATVKEGDTVTVFDKDSGEVVTVGSVAEIRDNTSNDNQDEYGGKKGTSTYIVEVEQLGRMIDPSKLSFRISRVESGAGAVDLLPSKEFDFTSKSDNGDVLKEIYTLVKVQPYSPNTFVVDKTTLDSEDEDGVYAAVSELDSITLEYAYMKKVGNSAVIDEDTKDTVEVELSDLESSSWTTAGWTTEAYSDDIKVFNGENETTLTLSTPVGTDFSADEDITIRSSSNGDATYPTHTLKVYIDVVEDPNVKYYGPAMSDILAALKVENNRVPVNDQVNIEGLNVSFDENEMPESMKEPGATDTPSVTIYVYATEEDAENNKNAIATYGPYGKGAQSKGVTAVSDLAVLGGTLYVRATTKHSMTPSDLATLSYGPEAYTFWGVTVDGEDPIYLNRAQVKRQDDPKQFVMDQLPTTFKITAVRFTRDGTTTGVVDESSKKTLSVQVADLWNEGQLSNLGDMLQLDTNVDLTYHMSATVTSSHLEDIRVSDVVNGDTKEEYVLSTMELDEPYGAPKRVDNGASTEATKTIIINDTAPEKFEVPSYFGEKYIEATRGKELDDYTDDDVTFTFEYDEEDEEKWSPEEGDLMDGVTYEFTIQKPDGSGETTVTGTFSDGDPITEIVKVVEGNTNGFYGFHKDTTSFDVYFTKDGQQSAPIPVSVPQMSGEEEISGVALPFEIKLELTTGSILKNSDLTDLLVGGDEWNQKIETVTVSTASGKTASIPLVQSKNEAPYPNKVIWKLWKNSNGEPKFEDAKAIDENGFKNALSTVTDESGVDTYYLIAELNMDDPAAENFANANDLLAKVEVKVYDNRKDLAEKTFPLQLTEGNNDLWGNLKPGALQAKDGKNAGEKMQIPLDIEAAEGEIARRNAGLPKDAVPYTAADFKTDLVFYYRVDSHEQVSNYLEGGLQSLGTNIQNAEAFKTWLEGEGKADYKIEELTDAGETVEKIEPTFSNNRDDYVTPEVSYKVLEKNYVIRYKVRYGDTVYVAKRNVLLTYRPGDIDCDGDIVVADYGALVDIFNDSTGKKNVFIAAAGASEEEKAAVAALNKKIYDYDRDGDFVLGDTGVLTDIFNSNERVPRMRW